MNANRKPFNHHSTPGKMKARAGTGRRQRYGDKGRKGQRE
jgi:hypothetical protein